MFMAFISKPSRRLSLALSFAMLAAGLLLWIAA